MRNKQKQWRTRALSAKRMAIKQGLHERGRRYGRFVKSVFSTNLGNTSPSTLFLNISENAGLITKAETA